MDGFLKGFIRGAKKAFHDYFSPLVAAWSFLTRIAEWITTRKKG